MRWSIWGFCNLHEKELFDIHKKEKMMIETILAKCDERYEKPECGECLDCTYTEYCQGDCEICLDYIHNPAHKVIELLKTIVFDMTQYANERDHIRKIVQLHFWLFGEQFNLASADERMKNALEKYINILYDEKDIEATLDEDAEQERRMDIFMCNARDIEASFGTTMEENIIVELKAPKIYIVRGQKVMLGEELDGLLRCKNCTLNRGAGRGKYVKYKKCSN